MRVARNRGFRAGPVTGLLDDTLHTRLLDKAAFVEVRFGVVRTMDARIPSAEPHPVFPPFIILYSLLRLEAERRGHS